MVEARGRERWNHTAELLSLLANCHRPADVDPFRRDDFHPYAKDAAEDPEEIEVVEFSMIKPMFQK